MLLGFSEFYTPEKILKRISIKALKLYFPKIIFYNTRDKEAEEDFIFFDKFIMMPMSIFDNYYYWGEELEFYSSYDCIKVIFYMKYSTRQKDDLLFDKHHSNLLSKV